ncbi:MAG: alpha/beta fold hydrolase [Rudaea sp.]|uniref:alpha/beta fold hydrolase n=1 Tax=unclassified Rudaea TaxID=2627037 RepID=UPI0010F62CF4|nr:MULTISPECIES: alpha/beta fold hydrolase [unclassified Rudaea]MBN8884136.1 alpha/beta fold hydrolase [Rudaea sp.]
MIALLYGIVIVLIASIVALALYAAFVARRVEAIVPPLGNFLEIGNARLHYVDRGSGPVVVLMHGLGGNLRNFHALIDRLVEGHRVIAVDRPGCGYSTMASGAQPNLFEQAAIVVAFMRALNLQRPLLVGHSLGGALALALALDHPDSIRALVLISPASHEVHDVPAAFKGLEIDSPLLRRAIAWTLAAPLGQLGHEATLRAVFAPERPTADFDTVGGGALGARPGNFIAASTDMVALPGALAVMTPHYPSLSLPLDVVFGRSDPICPVAVHGKPLADAVPGAELHLLPGGHMIPITQADAVARLIATAAAAGSARPETLENPALRTA